MHPLTAVTDCFAETAATIPVGKYDVPCMGHYNGKWLFVLATQSPLFEPKLVSVSSDKTTVNTEYLGKQKQVKVTNEARSKKFRVIAVDDGVEVCWFIK